jgi:hypothetical protein
VENGSTLEVAGPSSGGAISSTPALAGAHSHHCHRVTRVVGIPLVAITVTPWVAEQLLADDFLHLWFPWPLSSTLFVRKAEQG